MNTEQLPHLETFAKAAEAGSFTAAARALGLTQAAKADPVLGWGLGGWIQHIPQAQVSLNVWPTKEIWAQAHSEPIQWVCETGAVGLLLLSLWCYTNRALAAVKEIERAVDPVDHPKTLGGTPMAHMGFMTKIGAHIARASTTVLMREWSARAALEAIEREELTWLGGVPTQLALMLMLPDFGSFDLRTAGP